MNEEVTAPARRIEWTRFQKVEQVLKQYRHDGLPRPYAFDALVELNVSSNRIHELLEGEIRK